jgi:ABC-type cobalamin/Fe3+-siderophores transport system ATPase subunit
MQIKSLKISGYKNLNIDLKHETDIIAAIGNNGSGKSNLLEALCYIFRSLYDKKFSISFNFDITYTNTDNKIIQIKNEKSKSSMLVDNTPQIAMENYLPKRIVIIYSGEEDRLWKNCIEPIYKEYIANINKSDIRGTSVMTELLPMVLYLNRFYWHIALLSLICSDSDDNKMFVKDILKINKIEKIKFDFKSGNYNSYTNSETLRFVKHIDSKAEYTLDEFKQVLESNNYNADDVFKYLYTAYTPKNTKILDDITIIFNENLTIEDLSEGEKKLLLIKSALEFAGQEDCLFILDEPDAHIHVSNKEEIIKMFDPYKHNRQIVFTTHSPTLTNCLDDNHLYLLDCGEIMEKEKQDILNNLIGDSWTKHEVGAFLANKKNIILLVEGKHDKIHIETGFHKLKGDYPALDFAIYSIGGESKIRPLMVGLYEAGDCGDKTYIAIYDNDTAGNNSLNNGFKEENNCGYKKMCGKEINLQDNFFAFTLPKPNGFTKDCTIENMFDASKYEEAYKEAFNKTLGYFANKPISDIHDDIICKSKNILSENSKNFSQEDFKNFRPLFDTILKIQNRKQTTTTVKDNTKRPKEYTIKKEKSKEVKNYYFIDARGVKAKGYLQGEPIPSKESKIVVCKDSAAVLTHVASCLQSVINIRAKLLSDNVLKTEENRCIFTQDYTFNSVSTAGSVILGRNTNGWKMWKDEKGKTLDEIYRKKK